VDRPPDRPKFKEGHSGFREHAPSYHSEKKAPRRHFGLRCRPNNPTSSFRPARAWAIRASLAALGVPPRCGTATSSGTVCSANRLPCWCPLLDGWPRTLPAARWNGRGGAGSALIVRLPLQVTVVSDATTTPPRLTVPAKKSLTTTLALPLISSSALGA